MILALKFSNKYKFFFVSIAKVVLRCAVYGVVPTRLILSKTMMKPKNCVQGVYRERYACCRQNVRLLSTCKTIEWCHYSIWTSLIPVAFICLWFSFTMYLEERKILTAKKISKPVEILYRFDLILSVQKIRK